jgi:WD40 repeat protein
VFTPDGRRLISAAADQSIRFWDTITWTEARVLRGHTDEVHAAAVSEPAGLAASTSKDGDLMLWGEEEQGVTDDYSRLPQDLLLDQVLPLDHSRVLLLRPGQAPELLNLKRDAPPGSLPEIQSSRDVLGWFGTNVLCHWNGTNQILVHELQGSQFVVRGAIPIDSGRRPAGVAYDTTRHLLAWTEDGSSTSVSLAGLAEPGRRVELRSDVPGLIPSRFSPDGTYLAALSKGQETLRVWNVDSGRVVASLNERIAHAVSAAAGRVLVAVMPVGRDHEIGFFNLVDPSQAPRRVPGKDSARWLATSPDGGLVASSTYGGLVRLFDPMRSELTATLHGHLNSVFGLAFSPDGRRLISASGGREAVKLWDVSTRQELLTLSGVGSFLHAARWSADGDVILVGRPWQAWRAPSWEEIAAAEPNEKTEIRQR